LQKHTDLTKESTRSLILKSLVEKLPVKAAALDNTKACFEIIKEELKTLADEMCEASKEAGRFQIKYRDAGSNQCELSFGEDVIIFYLYADVFDLDPSHPYWKTSYLKDDRNKGFCGMIGIFNFLSNSFRLNRKEDVGYMIGRVFINTENHFFTEGKRQLAFLFNDFINSTVDQNAVRSITESAVQYCLEFDLQSPPYSDVMQVRVGDIQSQNQQMNIKTGKRLGFRFEADTDHIE
jgi:hypothetical protein